MREIDAKEIKVKIKELIATSCIEVCKDTLNNLKLAMNNETYPTAKEILKQIIANDELASLKKIPACQDTGIGVLFISIGQEVHIIGDLKKAVNEAVGEAYVENYLRKSVVLDPFNRINSKNNTPAIIHFDVSCDDKVEIAFMPKGAGSENMSKINMMLPTSSKEEVIDYICEVVKNYGANACPPLHLGIGIGGDFEYCALLAKKALLKDYCDEYKDFEKEIKDRCNKLNIGPMGLRGDCSVLDVKVLTYPCHIASLPVAICMQCHSNRHAKVTI